MDRKKIFSLLLLLFGEALLIFCFLQFAKNTRSEILVLNICISSVVYFLAFANVIFPWLSLKDKSQKQIGSIGPRWFFSVLYAFFAIGLMIYLNSVKPPVPYSNQLLIHAILFFLLLCGLYMSFSSSEKVREVYGEEKQNRDRIDEMKKATKELQLKLDAMNNMPPEIINRINELQENLRYLSPCNNNTSVELESNFLKQMRELNSCFSEPNINIDNVINNIKNCERTYKERKQVFSN